MPSPNLNPLVPVQAAGGELALVEHIRALAAPGAGRLPLGIGDDAAVLRLRPGEDLVVTTDLLLEGRHFRRDWHTAHSAGHRCLARGLSDLAAMGARPVAAFLSLALPAGYDPRWLEGFLAGLFALAEHTGTPLAGGDTAQAPGAEIVADIVLTGAVPRGHALRRDRARPGDSLYVTGSLGGSAVELRAMAAGEPAGEGRQSFPEPRLAQGRRLLRRGLATAAMDLSDGLGMDLPRLCRASGVSAALDSADLPLAPGATLEDALGGGEDYELLFSAAGRVPRSLAGVPVTRIGSVGRGSGVTLDGAPLAPGGWEHHV